MNTTVALCCVFFLLSSAMMVDCRSTYSAEDGHDQVQQSENSTSASLTEMMLTTFYRMLQPVVDLLKEMIGVVIQQIKIRVMPLLVPFWSTVSQFYPVLRIVTETTTDWQSIGTQLFDILLRLQQPIPTV